MRTELLGCALEQCITIYQFLPNQYDLGIIITKNRRHIMEYPLIDNMKEFVKISARKALWY